MQIFVLTALLVSFLTLETDSASINGTASAANEYSNSTDLQPFIVGGVEANKNEFPWLVRLTIKTSKGSSLCGGTLIKLNAVLLAAHCVNGISAGNIEVIAGDHDTAVKEDTEQKQTGKSVKVHGKYNSNETLGELNDIAIVILKKAFKQTDYVRAISLPKANSSPTRNGTVAGWGRLQYNGPLPRVVMKVTIPIVTNSSANCTRQVRDGNTQICAGQTGKDSCQGDSGGALLCNSTAGSYEVCGIVSYGRECARAGFPGVYTKVSSYVDWINKNNSNQLIYSSQLILLCSLLINFVLRY